MKFILIPIALLIAGISCKDNSDKNPANDPALKDVASTVINETKGFYFVGMNSRVPSVYYYDFTSDTIKLIKSKKNEKILELELSPDGRLFYYLTYRRLNKRLAIPEIDGIKIYRFEPSVNKSEFLKSLPPSIQVYSYWMDNDRFRVVSVSFDEVVASYINKNALTFNYFGKLLSDESELFDLIKNGYPVVEVPEINTLSPRKRFEIITKNDTVFVKNTYDNSESNLELTKDKILKLSWAEDLKHLIVMIRKKSSDVPDAAHSIFIYDLINKKIVKTFEQPSIKSFVVLGGYLMYDYKSAQEYKINIVRLSDLEIIKTINKRGGCALKGLPVR